MPETAGLPAAAAPAPTPPGLDLTQPANDHSPGQPMVKQWWFWTALGVAVATTVVILVLTDGGPAAPNTILGNREFRP